MIAYKLFRIRKNGTLGTLFINKKQIIPIGIWIKAEDKPTKGYAHRPGWHCCEQPQAPHLSEKERFWFKVEIKDFYFFKRPQNQGGNWIISDYIKILEKI